MKKESGNNIRLGIFVTGGIVLFVAAIYFIGQKQHLFSNTFRISGIFNNVSGLQVGNNVRFAGINVGTIEHIEIINDSSVKVDMIIDEDTRQFIKKDAVAMIGSDGLMGSKILNIGPGSIEDEPIKHNDFIRTIQPINMDEVFSRIKVTADNAAIITTDLSTITGRISSGKGTIGKLFMDTALAESINRTMVNIEQGSKGFKENMDATKNSILLRGYFKKKQRDKEEKKNENKNQQGQ